MEFRILENKHRKGDTARDLDAIMRRMHADQRPFTETGERRSSDIGFVEARKAADPLAGTEREPAKIQFHCPPLVAAGRFVQEVALESLSSNIRPLGQLDESFYRRYR